MFDFTLGFFAVLILGAISLSVQEILLYRRLQSLVDKIEDFFDLHGKVWGNR